MNIEFFKDIFKRSIEVYRHKLESYKEYGAYSDMSLRDIYRHVGLNFFQVCTAKGLHPNQIPGDEEVIPYVEFIRII